MKDMGMEAQVLEVYHGTPSLEGFDLVVSPVHLSPENPALAEAKRRRLRIITHHRAVGDILAPGINFGMKIFEVTGTHSKTSTALLLSRMLSGQKSVVSHTTRGIEAWSEGSSRLIQGGLSITPGNVIKAMEVAEAVGADALICEISLGGTGLADFGVLTSFSGDYMIAGRSRWASTAKLQMLSLAKPRAKLVANVDCRLSCDLSFGEGGTLWADGAGLHLYGEAFPLDLSPDLDLPSYQTAISAAVAASLTTGLVVEDIVSALEGFDGFSGRMKLSRVDGLTLYDSSNSGLKVADVAKALDTASGGILCLVVGEEAQTVCEGMDVPALVRLLSERRDEVKELILVGERLLSWAEGLRARAAHDLKSGEAMARSLQGLEKILLCVKCFR
jgi:UDP-N-acetylmuramyl pentapeptide synthase